MFFFLLYLYSKLKFTSQFQNKFVTINKMKNKIIYLTVLILLFSCSEKGKKEGEVVDNPPPIMTVEEMAQSHIQAKLSIPSTEKYTFKIYKEHLDGDNKIDAIITVNRLNYALEEAVKSSHTAKRAEVGFIGNYNYIFFFDGGLNQISPPMAVPSTPYSELKVHFENLTSAAYKDILIDYKIMNSSYRNYYSVMEHSPTQVFQWKTYGNIGKEDEEILFLELSEGTIGLAKDILIYEGNLDNASELKDVYKFDAKISKKGKLLHRFFYFENERKYFTKK